MTSLDEQIKFIESVLEIVKTPMQISLLASLKELRGIKRAQVKKLMHLQSRKERLTFENED